MAQSAIDPASEAAQYLKIVEDAGNRAYELVKKLLMFGCNKISEPQSIDINKHTTDLKRILNSVVGDSVELVLNVDDTELFVRIDPIQYEQIIVNLAVNARDAMPDGGTLTISTGVRGRSRHGDKLVVVTVEDSGTGMDSAIKERIFDPFFTTKDPGKGTGLGLSTCHGIVKSVEGQILVSSELGRGSKFELLFPRVRHAMLQKCA